MWCCGGTKKAKVYNVSRMFNLGLCACVCVFVLYLVLTIAQKITEHRECLTLLTAYFMDTAETYDSIIEYMYSNQHIRITLKQI